ncbi:MAG: class I adenylate-forming enzyme family protein [Microthrixaceae bacterium]
MLAEAVASAAHTHGSSTAISRGNRATTWAEVHLAAERLAGNLAPRIAPGDVVALCMHSNELWVIAAVAVNRLGAVIAGISPVVTPSERRAMIEMVSPSLVLADRDLIEGIPLRTEVLEVSIEGLNGSSDAAPPPMPRRSPGDDFAICFTSGTTGAPKAARFTLAAARAVQRIDSAGAPRSPSGARGPQVISSTQFAHVGFVLKLAGHALAGSTIHLMERWSASEVIGLIEAHRVAVLGVVAPQLALMLASPAMAGADLSSLRLIVAGGAPSPPSLVTQAREVLGVDYSIRWSSTESGGVGLAGLVDDAHPEAMGTIGTPRQGVQARVAVDPGTTTGADPAESAGGPTEAAIDEVGELQVRSEAMMAGYLGDAAATRDAFSGDGWLRTGDLAYRRADGRFVLAGRRGDMYIRGGYNVHPTEVEAVLGTHPCVGDVAVVPRDDTAMGQVGVAVVVPNAGRTPTLEELRSFAGVDLSKHKLPEDVVVIDALPVTRAGKLDRAALADRVASPGPTEAAR